MEIKDFVLARIIQSLKANSFKELQKNQASR